MDCRLSDLVKKCLKHAYYGSTGCWVFMWGGMKLERFFPKNQHTQRKLLNFLNWGNGEASKIAKI